MNTVLKNTLAQSRKRTAKQPHDHQYEKHEPWLERLLDRAVGLYGKRRFWMGVEVKRFRTFCYESGHVGMDVVGMAAAQCKHHNSNVQNNCTL